MPHGTFNLADTSILVTGGSGSFGRAFIEHVLSVTNVRRVVVYSRDEHKQSEFALDLGERARRVRFFIGDVRDAGRLETAMRGIDYVVHAAALKHVTVAEYNPMECIHTNVLGAENVVNAAIKNGVHRVIALSTDKAANPVNLYGASKLASDKIMVTSNNLVGHGDTRFSVLRYGNVLSSRGSVVPLFRRLIAEGADALPITDPEMTRFWITLPQAVDFVLSCFAEMRGGEIFVPKIPSMRVVDLAEALAPGMPTKIVGIRPGEKLHEVMITEDDSRHTLEQADRYIIEPEFVFWVSERPPATAASPVANGFRYDSASNCQWLGVEELRAMLDGTAPTAAPERVAQRTA